MLDSGKQMDLRVRIHTVFAIVILCTPIQYFETEARAIMVEPPHRSSLWRFNYSNALVNLKDDNLNCGGYDVSFIFHCFSFCLKQRKRLGRQALLYAVFVGGGHQDQKPFPKYILKNILCLFLQHFVKLKITQLLTG